MRQELRGIGLLALLCAASHAAAELKSELIFPLQDKHVHASSIVECPNGDLLACWFHGSGERTADDVVIQGARLRKGSAAWSPVFVMADTPDMPDCNPVLFIDAEHRLWLFWMHVMANRWEHSLLKYRRAEDYLGDGPPAWSWQDMITLKPGDSFPAEVRAGFDAMGFTQGCWGEFARAYDDLLVEAAADPFKRQKGWMTRNHPTVLPSGRILLPLYSDGFNFSLIALSDDLGATWRPSKPIVGLGPTQPSIVRKRDNSLVAYLRDEGDAPQRVQLSTSRDEGETWTPGADTDIPNPSASLEVLALASGNWVMIFNDSEVDRHSLVMGLSEDEGATWGYTRSVENLDGGSFAYPSMLQSADGNIHISYSYRPEDNSASIKHAAFSEAWVMESAAPSK